ncbi:MAG: DUF1573 domain-containing protein [Spirochaetales bacterium]|nr:DUF1573 domain-containing protein [Spirochaetales bacterium]
MKNINPVILLLLFLTLLNIPGCTRPFAIQFEKEIHDFGVVEEGEKVNYTYIFKNNGTEPVTIRYVQPSCVCTRILEWDKMVSPGTKGRISVILDTPRYNGDVVKLIDVKTNIPEQKSIRLTLKGRIIIPIELIPLNSWLGEVNAETEFLRGSVEIKNNADTSLKITGIIPPDNDITYSFTIIEEDQRYKLDYILYPPFKGKEKVEKKFTFKTNNEKNEYVSHKFFYYIPSAPVIHSLSFNSVNKSDTLDCIR